MEWGHKFKSFIVASIIVIVVVHLFDEVNQLGLRADFREVKQMVTETKIASGHSYVGAGPMVYRGIPIVLHIVQEPEMRITDTTQQLCNAIRAARRAIDLDVQKNGEFFPAGTLTIPESDKK